MHLKTVSPIKQSYIYDNVNIFCFALWSYCMFLTGKNISSRPNFANQSWLSGNGRWKKQRFVRLCCQEKNVSLVAIYGVQKWSVRSTGHFFIGIPPFLAATKLAEGKILTAVNLLIEATQKEWFLDIFDPFRWKTARCPSYRTKWTQTEALEKKFEDLQTA